MPTRGAEQLCETPAPMKIQCTYCIRLAGAPASLYIAHQTYMLARGNLKMCSFSIRLSVRKSDFSVYMPSLQGAPTFTSRQKSTKFSQGSAYLRILKLGEKPLTFFHSSFSFSICTTLFTRCLSSKMFFKRGPSKNEDRGTTDFDTTACRRHSIPLEGESAQ